jgi:hypothetical protein
MNDARYSLQAGVLVGLALTTACTATADPEDTPGGNARAFEMEVAPPVPDPGACPADTESWGVWGKCDWQNPRLLRVLELEWSGALACARISGGYQRPDVYVADCLVSFSIECSNDAGVNADQVCWPGGTLGEADQCAQDVEYFTTGTYYERAGSFNSAADCNQFISGETCDSRLGQPKPIVDGSVCGSPDGADPVPSLVSVTCCEAADGSSGGSDGAGSGSGDSGGEAGPWPPEPIPDAG